jgi:hypothetical protein
MGRSYKEQINGKEYFVVVINGSKCKTNNHLGCFLFYCGTS